MPASQRAKRAWLLADVSKKNAVFDDLLQVRCPGACIYVLRDSDGLFLIDTGFVGASTALRRALAQRKWADVPVRGLLITHGHLDHIKNVSEFATPDCWIAGPGLDQAHYEQRYPYSGVSRVCGILEQVGRTLFGFSPFRITRPLSDGDEISIWGGLIAIHLPGHTIGHMGFYSPQRRFLFCGDLFASFRGLAHLPPNIFNSQPAVIPASIDKALRLPLDGIAPNHCDKADYHEHLSRLRLVQMKIC